MGTERRPVDPADRPAPVDDSTAVMPVVDDLACDLAAMSPDDLVALNMRLGEARSTILSRQRQVTAEIDRRTAVEHARHRDEMAALGATPAQRLQL